ncbi:hypothetical protein MHBO_003641 [Bonamia ostreae]|uniref:Uncharacterized protein n=1 Tax=Bonamia ostreae TaxID=126728 RepID=A0ABV2AR26_9EUKA
MRSLWVSCSDDGVPSVTTIMTYKITQACLYESIDHGKILSGCKMNGPCVFYCDMFYQSRLGTRYGEEDCIFRGFVHQPCCQPAPTLYVVIIVPIVVVLLVFFLTISFFRRILCFRSPKNRNKSSGISTQTVVLTDSKNKTSANTNSNEEEVFEIIV